MRIFLKITLLLISLLVISACSFSPAAAPTPSIAASPEPTITQTPAPTNTPEPTPTPTLAPGDKTTREKDGMTMVYVPGGEFTLGMNTAEQYANCEKFFYSCNPGEFSIDTTRTVKLDSFWIDQMEVTYAQFAKCVEAGICELTNGQATRCVTLGNCDMTKLADGWSASIKPEYLDHPVVNVNWLDAERYCDWVGARLPTSSEWEAAARGTDGRIYPWGNESPYKTLLNYNHTGDTTVVGSYPEGASPYGALDMAGNVSEWVSDWYSDDYYVLADPNNPQGAATGEYRIMRGSSWFDWDADVALSVFTVHRPQNYDILYGFRCAASEP